MAICSTLVIRGRSFIFMCRVHWPFKVNAELPLQKKSIHIPHSDKK